MTQKDINEIRIELFKSKLENDKTIGDYSEELIFFHNNNRPYLDFIDRMYEITLSGEKFKKSFPNIEFEYSSNESIDETVANAWHEGILIDKDYKTPCGIISNGKVYINSDSADAITFYEISAHLYLMTLKISHPDKYNEALKLALNDKELVEDFKKRYNYIKTDKQIAIKIFEQKIVENCLKTLKEDEEKQKKNYLINKIIKLFSRIFKNKETK